MSKTTNLVHLQDIDSSHLGPYMPQRLVCCYSLQNKMYINLDVLGPLMLYWIKGQCYSKKIITKQHRRCKYRKLKKGKNLLNPIKLCCCRRQSSILSLGTHLIISWYEGPIIYDVRAKPYVVEGKAGSRDLQMFIELWVRIMLRVLPSIIHETLQGVVAKAGQLITQRDTENFDRMAANFNIALDDVSITNLTFGKDFLNAIEAKQVAAQEAERAKFVVEKAEQDKKSAVIRAEGEATSAKLISQVIANNPVFITLRKIEAAREIARVISDSKNKIYLNPDELLPNIQETNVL
ncbi:prohibitin-1 [Pyrus ussuriensis x Pyrus communis]|uniref:Prohibitin n=1 Tax=Pyrus ussuriensis x Pyrus communis TaxID=2448454 RepID=A0A5N5GQW2_9ROSA|nr:prohibitin-1 [Pyrus ussuriensis x Pyrus communis]